MGLGYLYQWPWEHPTWTWEKLFETIGCLLPFLRRIKEENRKTTIVCLNLVANIHPQYAIPANLPFRFQPGHSGSANPD